MAFDSMTITLEQFVELGKLVSLFERVKDHTVMGKLALSKVFIDWDHETVTITAKGGEKV